MDVERIGAAAHLFHWRSPRASSRGPSQPHPQSRSRSPVNSGAERAKGQSSRGSSRGSSQSSAHPLGNHVGPLDRLPPVQQALLLVGPFPLSIACAQSHGEICESPVVAEVSRLTLRDELLQQLHDGRGRQRSVDRCISEQRAARIVVDVHDKFFVRAAVVTDHLAPCRVLLLAARRVRLQPVAGSRAVGGHQRGRSWRAHVKNGGHLYSDGNSNSTAAGSGSAFIWGGVMPLILPYLRWVVPQPTVQLLHLQYS